MSNFDIGTLLDFKPATYTCEKCKALLLNGLTPHMTAKRKAASRVQYIPDDISLWEANRYLESQKEIIRFKDPIRQGQKLAAIAYNFSKNEDSYPPMRALL